MKIVKDTFGCFGELLLGAVVTLLFVGGLTLIQELLASDIVDIVTAFILGGLTLAGAYTCLVRATDQGTRLKVGALALAYLCILISYGTAYFLLFKFKASPAFVFSDSIVDGEFLERFSETTKNAKHLGRRMFCLTGIEARPRVSFSKTGSSWKKIDSHLEIKLVKSVIPQQDGDIVLYELLCRDEMGQIEFGGSLYGLKKTPRLVASMIWAQEGNDFKEFTKSISELLLHYEKEYTKVMDEIWRQVISDPRWKLWDFIYFSTSTFTTLGYGDILPSCREARLLVMSQSIFGAIYIAFSFIFLWPGEGHGDKGRAELTSASESKEDLVVFVPGRKRFHQSKGCSFLARTTPDKILEITESQAHSLGMSRCSRCVP